MSSILVLIVAYHKQETGPRSRFSISPRASSNLPAPAFFLHWSHINSLGEITVSTEESRAVVQSWLDKAATGDVEGAFALFAHDAVWSNIGTTRFSGEFVGLGAIMEGLVGPLFSQLEAGISSDVEAVIADGERVVVLSQGSARTTTGKDYNNTYAQVFTVRDGKIVQVREYMDTALVDAVFGAA